MADSRAVWGIEIGQAGLKAIRLRYAETAGQVIAVAFDYVPHPKLLSQPDAVPEELIPQALDKFLSRNDIGTDAVAISVPGQAALTRFIQLPPVESGKVSDIVKYEARQQIPFALEDVIWDYQVLAGGQEESGYLLGAEVGLFAMKRDQVSRFLRPFLNAKVEVDLIQIAPLALYNVLLYDQLGMRQGEDFSGADQYTIILDMGADNTTLLVSNGHKIWIRNVPIGGNHFTRALTKEMKLTFAKAEHLKCNATKSDDPRAVFQALRPVFNDYIAEIQRSIGYFSSVNRDAKIAKIIGCGNGFKLAGLQKFLQQNLQQPVERLDKFKAVVGDTVLNAPLFEENILSFAVPYGLALQQLGLSTIHTSLLPPEIAVARKIRSKKPWAVAAAAAALLVFSISAYGFANRLQSAKNPEFDTAIQKADNLKQQVESDEGAYKTAKRQYTTHIVNGRELVKPLETRGFWPDLYRAIDECLPREAGDPDEVPIELRKQISINSVIAEPVEDLSTWFDELTTGGPAPLEVMLPQDKAKGPAGPGIIITLQGTHYNGAGDFVHDTLLKNLQQWTMKHEGTPRLIPVRLMGITHATVIAEDSPVSVLYDPESQATSGGGFTRGGFDPGGIAEPDFGAEARTGYEFGAQTGGELPLSSEAIDDDQQKTKGKAIFRYDFTVQFVWRQTSPERQLYFYKLHLLFEKNPKITLTEAKKSINIRTFYSNDFNAYKEMHRAPSSPATE